MYINQQEGVEYEKRKRTAFLDPIAVAWFQNKLFVSMSYYSKFEPKPAHLLPPRESLVGMVHRDMLKII